MSYSTGGEHLLSSRKYHESLPPEDSRTASLSSQLSLYNSELAPSSQPCAENTFYRGVNRYSLSHIPNHDDQQQQLQYQLEKMNTPLTVPSLPRSSPIAIIRAPGDRKKEADESDIDDHDSDIDVEGDAIKLQRKYGNKIIQSYIQESTISQSSNIRMRDKSSVLNAPYLGSLSKSSNQVLSLPPISLAGDSTYLGEPPESIVSYGSLRDSHERGRFLDGPSSYREPMSGKIRQLDHRLRYHGRQPELNIGERLQQSRKLKELRLKEENKNKKKGSNSEVNTKNSYDREKKERKEAKSSLSAMMKDASRIVITGVVDVDGFQDGSSFLSTEHMLPIQRETVTSTNSPENRSSINSSPRNMLSTSLTAFELLKSSNTDTLLGSNITNPSHSVTRVKSSGFQPLARSMSDPSPRLQNLTISEVPPTSVLPAIQSMVFAAQLENVLAHSRHCDNHVQLQQEMQHPANERLADIAHFTCEKNANAASASLIPDQVVMINDGGHRSSHVDHDPNTDGAFGDMDL